MECDVELGELQPEYFRNFGAWQKRHGFSGWRGWDCWWLGGLLTSKISWEKGEVGIFLLERSRWWYQILLLFTPILAEMIQFLTLTYFKFRAGKNPRKCILLEWTFCMTTYFGLCKVSSSQTSWVVVRGVAPKTQLNMGWNGTTISRVISRETHWFSAITVTPFITVGKGSWPWGNQLNSHPFNPWNFSPWTYPNSLNALKWWVAGACLYNPIYIYIEGTWKLG